MGMLPCSGDRKRFRGPAQHAYPAIVDGQDAQRAHLRLCPGCFATFTETCKTKLNEVVYDGETEDVPSRCLVCDAVSDLLPVFVNTYPLKAEEVDYYGHVCPSHVKEVGIMLLIS